MSELFKTLIVMVLVVVLVGCVNKDAVVEDAAVVTSVLVETDIEIDTEIEEGALVSSTDRLVYKISSKTVFIFQVRYHYGR